MTVASETSKVQYNGDGVTTDFSVTFKYTAKAQIVVVHTDSDGVETTWVLGTQYTLTDPGASGTLTVEVTPTDYTPASGETLTIYRDPDFTQASDYTTGGGLTAEGIEADFDTRVFQIQRLREMISRAILFPQSTAESDLALPELVAGKVLGVNSAGDGFEFVDTGEGGGGAGDVTSSANITDHAIVRGDGGAKGVQDSGVIIDDSDNITGVAGFTLSGNITVGGTVDGRDVAADGTKLDGIESGATADQTQEEIQDAAWAAVSGGTQTLITVTYQDATNDVDFVVDNDLANYDNTTSDFLDATTAASTYQPLDAGLTDVAGLAVTDGNIIVGDGANWVAESGNTARTSLGLGTGDSPTFTALTVPLIQGGSGSGDDLRLTSTTNATKGTINLGNASDGVFYDEANERLSIGSTVNTITINGVALGSDFSVHNDDNTDVCSVVFRYSDIAGFPACILGARSRGSIASPAIVQDDDALTLLSAFGFDGTDYALAAQIVAEVDGTPGANDMPTRWVCRTSPNGTQLPVEGWRLDSAQIMTFANTPLVGANAVLDAGDIGSSVQAYDADLDTWSGLTPSANFQTLVTQTFAQIRGSLDLEAGTDFYSISAADTAFLSPAEGDAAYQPLDSDLTSWAGVTRAAGLDTFAATPSSANLASLVTDETGSGALAFATSPTLVTPALGTPSSGNLSNCTSYPSAAEGTNGIVDQATDAEIRAATSGAHAIMAEDLSTANALVTLTDATTVAIDWTAGINFTLTLTTDRILGNPTNEIPGTFRTVFVISDGGPDTLTFGSEYGGTPPTLDDITTTQGYLLSIFCRAAGQFLVSSMDGSPA